MSSVKDTLAYSKARRRVWIVAPEGAGLCLQVLLPTEQHARRWR